MHGVVRANRRTACTLQIALLPIRPECLAQLSFDVVDACEDRGKQAPWMTWRANQSFYSKSILDDIKLHVCSLLHSLTNCRRGAPNVEERGRGG